ncbi:MAG TPA: CAP family protein [Sphingomicrobium sp.]|nr:CAP family protein [Sphingomicrobium sp.]
MRILPIVAAAAAVLSFAGAASAAGQRGTLILTPQVGAAQGVLAERLLRAHNVERAALRLPPLAWDPALAASASDWGRVLAASGTMRHANQSAQGENLWMGTRGAFTPEQMVGNWASEKRMFMAQPFPNVSRTGNWADVGHYTQIVWRGTTHVGCAIVSSSSRDFLVCRYSPPGNVRGRPVY